MMRNGPWDRFKSTDRRRAKQVGVTIGGVFVGAFVLCGVADIRINASPSLPIGLYMAIADAQATLVEFCPPEPYASLAIRRGYRTDGVCPDGATPLLKPIVARAGDLVEISEAGVHVNGRLLKGSAPRTLDTSGRPMPVWPLRVQRVRHGTVWVVSSYNPRSFDSRYFGPIAVRTIMARVRPVVVVR